jgi:hypothetical protein
MITSSSRDICPRPINVHASRFRHWLPALIVDEADEADDGSRPSWWSWPAAPSMVGDGRSHEPPPPPSAVIMLWQDSVFSKAAPRLRPFHSTTQKHMVATLDITAKIASW